MGSVDLHKNVAVDRLITLVEGSSEPKVERLTAAPNLDSGQRTVSKP
jgi:hypothetical protein